MLVVVPFPEHGGVGVATLMAVAGERYHRRRTNASFSSNDLPHRPPPIEIEVRAVPCSGPHGYGDLLASMWERGEAFINLEHDVAPWPGALTQMWECDKPWCALPLIVHQCVNDTNLGCAKFSADFIAATPELWRTYPRNDIFDWRSLDSWLYQKLSPRVHHRHEPPALHMNEAHL